MAFDTPILDSFTGSDEDPIATNWSGPIATGIDQLRRVSNQLAPDSTNYCGSWYDVSTFGPDCEAYLTIAAKYGVNNALYLYARATSVGTAGIDGYVLQLNEVAAGTDTLALYRVDNWGLTQITTLVNQEVSVGDKIGIRCMGSRIEAWYWSPGGGWVLQSLAIDSNHATAGYIGLEANPGAARWDDFGGGVVVPTGPVLDDFNRADNASLGANWTIVNTPSFGADGLKIVSNHVEPFSLGIECLEMYTGISFSSDQYSQAKMTVTDTDTGVGPCVAVRCDANGSCYRASVSKAAANNIDVVKFVDDVFTDLGSLTEPWVDGDVLRLEVRDATLRVFRNGVQLATVDDSSLTTGPPGIGYSTTATLAQIDDWEGGDLEAETGPNGTPLLDDFNRADAGTLGASWIEGYAGSQRWGISTNRAVTAGSFAADVWAAPFVADQEVWATVVALPPTGTFFRLPVRIQDPTKAGNDPSAQYHITIWDDGTWYLEWLEDGQSETFLDLGSFGLVEAGWRVGLAAIGNTLRAYKDTGTGWQQVGTDVNNSRVRAGGYIGMYSGSGTGQLIDDFGGGTIAGPNPSIPALGAIGL